MKNYQPQIRRLVRQALLFLAATAFAAGAFALPLDLGIGNLSWSDEFGANALDLSKWNYRYPGPRHDAVNTADAVSVGNGVLSISTYTEGGINYTGMIGTQGLFQQAYGYFEARISFHDAPGSWSAFWLQSPSFGNPIGDPAAAGTETDIVEHRAADQAGQDITSQIASAVHWDGYGAAHKSVGQNDIPDAGMSQDTWHTFGLLWTPDSYSIYFDDTLFWTETLAVSQRSEYLVLSSEVRDASWAGNIPLGGYGAAGVSTTVMQVDYIRVYGLPEPNPAALSLIGLAAWAGCRRKGR
jgi:beta-glucanase (GH16 family)